MREGLCRTVLGHPLYVWLLWAAGAAVLATCPLMLSEPAMWFYLADPELLALVVIVGVRYSRSEIAVLSARTRMELRRWAHQSRERVGLAR